MGYSDYLKALLTSWWIVAGATLLGAVAALVLATAATPQYQSSTQLFVSGTGASDVASATQGSEFSRQRVISYAQLLTGKDLATAVIDRLDLDLTPAEFSTRVVAEVVPDTVLLTVTVTDPAPEQALAIAEAIGVVFAAQVEKLETPAGAQTSPVVVTTVATPDLAAEPSSPATARMLSVVVALGLLAGLGTAVLRQRLDTSVKDDEAATSAGRAPVIGRIVADEALDRRHTVDWTRASPVAEGIRQLRTNLQFLRPDSPARVVMVTSAVPGEGKTTVALNLAQALCESGRRVVLVEADLRRPRAARYLGLVEGVGLTNVLTGQAGLDDVLQPHGGGRLTLLAAGPTAPNPGELLASAAMATLLGELSSRADLVIVDAAPLLPVADALGLAPLVDGALLCCRYGETATAQLVEARGALDKVHAATLGIVLTMIPPRLLKGARYGYGYGYEAETRHAQPNGQRPVRGTAPAVVETAL